MALLDRVTHALAMAPWLHEPLDLETRETPLDTFQAEIAAIRLARQNTARPWRPASVSEAMGVPSIFGAVTLISNIIGSLTLRAYRGGIEVPDMQRPPIVIRPNPFTIPREWGRETGWAMAAYGDAWWWVAARDSDDMPLSVMPVNPTEVMVTENPRDLRYPVIEWRGRRMRNEDMRQIKLTGPTGALRGTGPLQSCGGAISIAVEAQEWAANFFGSGGNPSVELHSEVELEAEEAQALLTQWTATPSNMPQVTSGPIEVREHGTTAPGAQMLDARNWSNGDTARFYQIPGSLLEYTVAGSSLTYQNVSEEFTKFVKMCLLPNYLEPMEQTMSDLLPRAWTVRFNTDALLRADPKTLMSIATLGFEKGVLDQTEARGIIGFGPDIETAPIGPSPPAAVPASLPIQGRSMAEDVRCHGKIIQRGLYRDCGRLLGKLAAPYEVVCPRCKTVAAAA